MDYPENWPQPSGLTAEGASSFASVYISSVSKDDDWWAKAEDQTAKLITSIQLSSHQRKEDKLLLTLSSASLRSALLFSTELKDTWTADVHNILKKEEKNADAEFRVKEVQYIHADVKIIRCLVENIVVDISFNQTGGICTLCFLEEVDRLIGQKHLFKRSIILVKAWCYYESRILGAHHGLISTFALETLVLYIFHVFHASLRGPLELPVRLTQEIVDTYQLCNPNFEYSEVRNPKRFLTHPSIALSNNGLDNANYDLILYFGQTLANDDHTRRYVVKDLVGCGAFGQVAKCLILETNEYVAVKVIKNQRAYSMQASVEIGILHVLNNTDRRNKHHVVRSFDHFSFEGHLCIVFELLGLNLFELLKTNNLKGIPLRLVRDFTSQLVDALTLLHDTHVIHCDLKPENVLLTSIYEGQIKLIDFGSACIEPNTVYTYIQSRFYRSPEVVLGHAYSTAIDMWSLGCVAAELFLGLPLFPGQSPYDLLAFIIEKLRVQPPDHILQRAVDTSKFFKVTSAAPQSAENRTSGHSSVYQFLTPEENEARENKKPAIGKRYMPGTLEETIMKYPMKTTLSKEEKDEELNARQVFLDFLRGLIEVDPNKRWSPRQAAQHPFLTMDPCTGPFKPTAETPPRVPTGRGMNMEHGANTGHWFGAGLSPQVGNLNLPAHIHGSPQYQPSPYALASSHGSPASFGSHGDAGALGSSFGSNGDGAGLPLSYPASLNGHPPLVAGSLDAQRRRMVSMQSTGQTHLGMSPSAGGGGMWPLSLGPSPSHHLILPGLRFQASPGSQQISSPGSPYLPSPGFVYQGSQGSAFQSSPGSSFGPGSPLQGSPNRYAPTSPAHAVRELAIAGQYNKRRNAWGSVPAAPINNVGVGSHDRVHWARLYQNNANGNADIGCGSYGPTHVGPPMAPHWQPLQYGDNSGILDRPEQNLGYLQGTLGAHFNKSETSTEAGDEESAGPGDWDADFREEHLFEHDPFPEGVGLAMPSGLGPAEGVMGCGGARLGPGPGLTMGYLQPSNGQMLPRRAIGPPMSVEGSPPSLQSAIQGLQSGYGRSQLSKHGQTSPSRLGPQYWQPLHKNPQAQNHLQHPPYLYSPQQSPDYQTSGSNSGQNSGSNSGAPSRRYLSGESSCTSSPAGVLQFQQKHQQHLSPQQSPDHLGLPGSPKYNNQKMGELAKNMSGLLPSPQWDMRSGYPGDGNARHMMGMVNENYVGMPDGRGFPMETGLGQPQYYVVDGAPQWSGQQPIFLPQGQIFPSDLFNGRKPGPPLVGVRPPTGRGGHHFPK